MTEKKVFKRALEMMSERFVRLAMELYHNYQSSEGVRQHYIEKGVLRARNMVPR